MLFLYKISLLKIWLLLNIYVNSCESVICVRESRDACYIYFVCRWTFYWMTEKHVKCLDTEMISNDIKCLVLLKLTLETNIALYMSNGELSHTGNTVIKK